MIYGNVFLDEGVEVYDESVLDNIKQKIEDISDLKSQWKEIANKFVKHKWIYRYTNSKQRERLEKYYEMLTSDDVSYQDYKKAFRYICQFMGIPKDMVIIEDMKFSKDKQDKEQDIIALRYSKGLAKVRIPDNVKLIHISPAENIKELIPSFRSKVKGKYMYPTKRCFFTVAKDIKATQAGLEHKKTTRYTPKDHIQTAYIDPTYADFNSGSIYVETDKPIAVENYEKKMFDIFKEK